MRKRLREIWLSRELLIYLVRTEIKVKYKNSVLGLVWSMVAPAMTLAIYFVVFQIVLGNKMPNFVIFLFAGLLLWNLFSLGVLTGTGVVVNNAGIVKKVSFPREILALAAVGSACVFFFFQAIVMVIFMVVLHTAPDLAYLPVLLLALVTGVVLASAIAVLLSSINVYLRDTQHLIEVILTAWFWACPIVYAYQQQIGNKLGPEGPDLDLLPQPDDAAGPVVPALHLRAPHDVRRRQRRQARPSTCCRPRASVWYVGLDLAVLFLSVVPLPGRPRHLRPARGQLRRGALSRERLRRRRAQRLQALPPGPRPVQLGQGAHHPRRASARPPRTSGR